MNLAIVLRCILGVLSVVTMLFTLMITADRAALSDDVTKGDQPKVQDEQISLEDGRIVKDLNTWLQTLQSVGLDNTKPKANEQDEFLRNWIQTTQTNIKRLSERNRVSAKKMEEYSAETRQDYLDLGRYISLQNMIAVWHDLKTTSPGAAEAERQRQKLMAERNQLLAPNGIDPYLLFEQIARESRPKPIELDDVQLVLAFKSKKTKPNENKVDYWAKTDKPITIDLTNDGEDASTYTWTMFDSQSDKVTLGQFIDNVSSDSMSCSSVNGDGGARCETTSLESGETKTFKMKTFVPEYNLDDLGDDHRINVTLIARARSEDPPAQADDIQLKISFRLCVTDYRKKLIEAGRFLNSAPALEKYHNAIRPIPELSGKSLFKYQDSFLDKIGIANKGHYIRQAIHNQGPDNLLWQLHVENARHPLVRGITLHRRMYDESIPKEMCARPSSEVSRIRELLSTHKSLVDEFADALSAAARKRAEGFKTSMSEGVGGDPLAESTKSFAADRGFDIVSFVTEKFSLWLGDTPQAATNAAKTVSILSFLNSLYSIYQNVVALNSAIPEDAYLDRTLGMMEATAYMEGLKKRYAHLQEVYETYLTLIESAYDGSCTCRDPF